MKQRLRDIEWPTLALVAGCYGVWALSTTVLAELSLTLAVVATTLTIALHSSLSHEIIHGHPFASARANAALVFPALGLFIPFGRFRDSHLDHHHDSVLTDPYDDPESNYLDPAVWDRLPRPVRLVLRFNNTLLGRLLVGPPVSMAAFILGDLRLARAGDARVRRGWLWHIPQVAPVLLWLATVGTMPAWAYLLSAYAGLSILKIRTYLEHRAHDQARARTVVIEDRGPLSWIFLNNNLHVVHHMHPRAAWYRLPGLYAAARDRYLARNDSYLYRSYGEVFRQHLLRAKDPVPHPLWRRG
jgi:fatty acid desaturase